MNVCVIIPAAGVSRRFGDADKLGQDLGGRPVLMRTVELFGRRDEVRSIIVAAPPEPAEALESFRERYGPALSFHGASVVAGGRDHRWQTVQAALAAVPDDATHVAVHDAARPGASDALLQRVFTAAETLPAVVPAVPVAATVKRVAAEIREVGAAEDDAVADLVFGDAGKTRIATRVVRETIDRSDLVEVQTPQVFTVELIRRAYAEADLEGVTDDASVVERIGAPVVTVEGDVRNFKITTPDDLALMRCVLNVKPPAERPVHKRF